MASMGLEKSSSSAALSFASCTTSGGKLANSATWMPKDWSHAPGLTWYSMVSLPDAASMAVSTCMLATPTGPCTAAYNQHELSRVRRATQQAEDKQEEGSACTNMIWLWLAAMVCHQRQNTSDASVVCKASRTEFIKQQTRQLSGQLFGNIQLNKAKGVTLQPQKRFSFCYLAVASSS